MDPISLMDILIAGLIPALLTFLVIVLIAAFCSYLWWKLGETKRQYQKGFWAALDGESCDSCHWDYVEGYKKGRDIWLMQRQESAK